MALAVAGAAGNQAGRDQAASQDPRQLLQRAGDYLRQQKKFRIEAVETVDEVLEGGQKIQVTNRRKVALRRPNRFYAEASGDTANRTFWYDGATITLLDREPNVYGTTSAPKTVDAMLDFVMQRYGIQIPLADLFYEKPAEILAEKVKTGKYLGIHQVGEWKCHHLAFTQDDLDWQIWLQTGDEPLLRKIVITYKTRPAQPQYSAVIQSWDLAADLPDSTFKFTPPQGAMKIEILPLKGAPEPAKE